MKVLTPDEITLCGVLHHSGGSELTAPWEIAAANKLDDRGLVILDYEGGKIRCRLNERGMNQYGIETEVIQSPLEGDQVAHARNTDPETSHEAAEKASVALRETQRGIMLLFRTLDVPVTDEEFIKIYRKSMKAFDLPDQSDQSIRSRRSELAKAGLIVAGEKKKMRTGGWGLTWSLPPDQISG